MNLTFKKVMTRLLLFVVFAVVAWLGMSYPILEAPAPALPAVQELGTTHFTAIEAEDVTATDDLAVTDDATITDDLAVGGDSTITGNETVGGTSTVTGLITGAAGLTLSDGNVVVADDLRITGQTAITVTDSTAFTATGTYQAIQAAGNVTPTITAGSAGDLLVLINTSNTTIKIQDTGTQMLTGDISLGQYDSLVLWSDGTNWIQVATANN